MSVREKPQGGVVVDLASRRRELSDAELRELRDLMTYMRTARPFLEAVKHRCPTARTIAADLDDG